MDLSEHRRVRLAVNVRNHLCSSEMGRFTELWQKLGHLLGSMERLQAMQRKLRICESRGWRGAGTKVTRTIEGALHEIPYRMQKVQRAVQACTGQVPPLREIYAELVQIEHEFGGFKEDRQNQELVVLTEPIELEGMDLGPFEIRLHLPCLAGTNRDPIYRVVALEPRPATSNDVVTHPHVSDGQLCPGDAGAAIHMALAGGRICDFFTLVRSVLSHYNPGSAYVSLDNWCGTPCYECGYAANGDDLYWCHGCEQDFCSDCASCCRRCDETICLRCLQDCPVCKDPMCMGCMTNCPDCGRPLCATCLEEDQCPCGEEKEEAEDGSDQEEASPEGRRDGNEASPVGAGRAGNGSGADTGSQVLADRVGQTAVLP